MRNALLAVCFASSIAACGYNPDLDNVPFLCGAEDPKCPDGYECKDNGAGKMQCVTTSGASIVDSGPPGFLCADDSALEGDLKNDTTAHAFVTKVADQRNDITFAGVSICPEGDKDTYSINIVAAMSSLEVTTSWDSGMPVSVSILNAGGQSINNGTSNGAMSLRAFAAMLPVGTYYAQAYASATTKNNYKIAIKVTPP